MLQVGSSRSGVPLRGVPGAAAMKVGNWNISRTGTTLMLADNLGMGGDTPKWC
jgi:hypothetical protein